MSNHQLFKSRCREFGEDPKSVSVTDLVEFDRRATGFEQLKLDGLLASLRTAYTCPHCGKRLYLSDISGYDFVCPECDENFYRFEAIKPTFAVA